MTRRCTTFRMVLRSCASAKNSLILEKEQHLIYLTRYKTFIRVRRKLRSIHSDQRTISQIFLFICTFSQLIDTYLLQCQRTKYRYTEIRIFSLGVHKLLVRRETKFKSEVYSVLKQNGGIKFSSTVQRGSYSIEKFLTYLLFSCLVLSCLATILKYSQDFLQFSRNFFKLSSTTSKSTWNRKTVLK